MKLKWTTKFPNKEGNYWFYGYRYGKMFGDKKNNPEWMIVKVRKCANGLMYEANGQFMAESEVEEAHFATFELPEFLGVERIIMKRYFSIPVLDEPFSCEFTQMIYSEDMADYKNENHGKPIPSLIVTTQEMGSSSGYIQGMENAEKEAAKRIEKALRLRIESTQDKLKRLRVAQKEFEKCGIKSFEVIL